MIDFHKTVHVACRDKKVCPKYKTSSVVPKIFVFYVDFFQVLNSYCSFILQRFISNFILF